MKFKKYKAIPLFLFAISLFIPLLSAQAGPSPDTPRGMM